MKRTNKKITVLFFLALCNYSLIAQVCSDSASNIRQPLQMISYPEPEFSEPYVADLSPAVMADVGFEQPYKYHEMTFRMRDIILIYGRKFEHTSNTTIFLLHGVLSNSYTYNKMAGLFREALEAEVIALDLKGHGQSGGMLGDITTLNQYAEDLEDLVSAIRADNPSQKII